MSVIECNRWFCEQVTDKILSIKNMRNKKLHQDIDIIETCELVGAGLTNGDKKTENKPRTAGDELLTDIQKRFINKK
ncbi:MAG: hypothetical protein N2166_02035 [candidate division WOR-3 bacterium]|nr:hypothetical protein [candidate division WOR-3 bacterium]